MTKDKQNQEGKLKRIKALAEFKDEYEKAFNRLIDSFAIIDREFSQERKEKNLWCDGGKECCCICHQKDYPLPKDFPTPESRGDWSERFKNEFGSYECLWSIRKYKNGVWCLIDDIKDFIRKELTFAHTEGIREGRGLVFEYELNGEELKINGIPYIPKSKLSLAKQEGIEEGVEKTVIKVLKIINETLIPAREGTGTAVMQICKKIQALQTKETKNNE